MVSYSSTSNSGSVSKKLYYTKETLSYSQRGSNCISLFDATQTSVKNITGACSKSPGHTSDMASTKSTAGNDPTTLQYIIRYHKIKQNEIRTSNRN